MSIRNYLNHLGSNAGKITGQFLAIDVAGGLTKSITANGSIEISGGGPASGWYVVADNASISGRINSNVFFEGNANLDGNTYINGNVYCYNDSGPFTLNLNSYAFDVSGDIHAVNMDITRANSLVNTALGLFSCDNIICRSLTLTGNSASTTPINGGDLLVRGVFLTATSLISNGVGGDNGNGGNMTFAGDCFAVGDIKSNGVSNLFNNGGNGGNLVFYGCVSCVKIESIGGNGLVQGGVGGAITIIGPFNPNAADCGIDLYGGDGGAGNGGNGGELYIYNGGNFSTSNIASSFKLNGGNSVGFIAGSGGNLYIYDGHVSAKDIYLLGGTSDVECGFGGNITLYNTTLNCEVINISAGSDYNDVVHNAGVVVMQHATLNVILFTGNGGTSTVNIGGNGTSITSPGGICNINVSSSMNLSGGIGTNGGNGGIVDIGLSKGIINCASFVSNGGNALTADAGSGGQILCLTYNGITIDLNGGAGPIYGGNGGYLQCLTCNLQSNLLMNGGNQNDAGAIAPMRGGNGGTITINGSLTAYDVSLLGGGSASLLSENGAPSNCSCRNLNCESLAWNEGTGGVATTQIGIIFILYANNYINSINSLPSYPSAGNYKLYGGIGTCLNIGNLPTSFAAWSTDNLTSYEMNDVGYDLIFKWKDATNIYTANAIAIP